MRAGEILGIAGVAGNGQIELMEALTGEYSTDAHVIKLNDAPVGDKSPTERRRAGMCCVPEERLGHGAVTEMYLWENTILSARTRKEIESNGFLRIHSAQKFAADVVAAFNVMTGGIDHAANSLSGGNLQKFIVGREVMQAPTVLVVSQPTWGVDAGAASDIHKALQKMAKEGAAILVISQDLDELMVISTRFAVIAEGRLSEPQPTGQLTVEEIGLLMGGVHSSAASDDNSEATHA